MVLKTGCFAFNEAKCPAFCLCGKKEGDIGRDYIIEKEICCAALQQVPWIKSVGAFATVKFGVS